MAQTRKSLILVLADFNVFTVLFPGDEHRCHMEIGLWVLMGLFCFLVIEKMFPDDQAKDGDSQDDENVNKVQ